MGLKSTGRIEKGDDFGVPAKASWQHPADRLKEMDRQGVGVALAFPTRGVCFEFLMRDDLEPLYAHLAAFNRWLDEQWGYCMQYRLFAPPLMNLTDIDQAVHHLDVNDPFWGRIDEAGVPVAFHICTQFVTASGQPPGGAPATPAVL